MTNTAAEVVIKAEYHNSKADLREGRKLLEEGVDYFIFEAQKEQAEYLLRHRWFQILMWLFSYFIMNRFVYTDHSVLKYIADRYEADKNGRPHPRRSRGSGTGLSRSRDGLNRTTNNTHIEHGHTDSICQTLVSRQKERLNS